MVDQVEPIRPELAPVLEADRLLEKMNRRYAEFAAEHGRPVAYAVVFMSADGTTKPSFQTNGFPDERVAESPQRGGWRGFLALAGARLTALSLQAD